MPLLQHVATRSHVIIILVLAFLVSIGAHAQLQGKVVKVADGDTFTLLSNNKQVKVRLYGIDCPERSQDFGQAARQFTSSLIFNRDVIVEQKAMDRNRRVVGIVKLGSLNLNEELLRSGYAWHYTRYDNNPKWTMLMQAAKRQKKGLWVQPNPQPPWQFRKNKSQSAKKKPHQLINATFSRAAVRKTTDK